MNIQTLTSPEPYHLKSSSTAHANDNNASDTQTDEIKNKDFRTLNNSMYLSGTHTDSALPFRSLLSPIHQTRAAKPPQQSTVAAAATTSTNTAMVYGNNNNHVNCTTSSKSNAMNDLQSVVNKYRANPELLRLILASKVEEDKRRTEEAKLKAKELDLYLKQQHQSSTTNNSSQSSSRRDSNSLTSTSGFMTTTAVPYSLPSGHRNSNASQQPSSHSPQLSSSMTSPRRNSINSTMFRNRSRSIGSASRANTNNLTSSATAPLNRPPDHYSAYQQPQHLNQSTCTVPPQLQHHHTLSLPLTLPHLSALTSSSASLIPQQPPTNNPTTTITSRRRRSIQAITKLIETSDFPYNDHYFWKNNGNTIQKKTGLKSTYYKCANSIKGCPVNKTVVEQPNGKYLIKYRGEHIYECSQFEHIKDF